MRTINLIAISWLVAVVGTMIVSGAQPQENASALPHIQRIDINKLAPANPNDWVKLLVALRSQDVPQEQRLAFARRQVETVYAVSIHTDPDKPNLSHAYGILLEDSIGTLARLEDVNSIPLLERRLAEWEKESQKSPHERTQVVPDLRIVRAALARLKAVRDVPQVRTAGDLVRRLERMLVYIGYEGSIQSWLTELEKEVSINSRRIPSGLGIHELVLRHYGRMLLQAAWNGVDVKPAYEIIRFNPNPEGVAKQQWATYVELAQKPREQVAQWIVDDAMRWKVLSIREECLSQVLMDFGASVVPIIQEKLQWAFRNRDKIEGTGMGLTALMEVLVTLAGEQALPFIEPYTQDSDEWVRRYACRAKEYIQQGKAFAFAPYF